MQRLRRVGWRLLAGGVGAAAPLVTGVSTAMAAGAGGVSISPNKKGLPGINSGESMAGGLLTWVLIMVFVAMAFSAGAWAVGHHSANPTLSSRGRMGAVVGFAAFLLLGAIGVLAGFFYKTGHGLH